MSRLLGVLRDSTLAWLLGAGATADALSAALRLPYLVRRLYGEGALSLELTVACVQARAHSPYGDAALARAVGRHLLPLCLIGCLVCLLAARPLMIALTPGLLDRPDVLDEAVRLFRLAAIYLPAALLAAISMAVLHSREIFAATAMSTSLFNVIVLLFLGLAACGVSSPAVLAAAGVAAGGLAQWAMQRRALGALEKELAGGGGAEVFAIQDCAPGPLLRCLPYGVLVAATPQLAFLGAAALTSLLADGALAALFYAERLLEFPLGVLGAAVGMAAAPRLARSVHPSPNADAPRETANTDESVPSDWAAERCRALSAALLLNIPAAAGLMAVAVPLVDLLFGHGAFSGPAVQATAMVLCAYAPGLPAYAASRPLLSACHAVGDRRTPGLAMLAGLSVSLAAGAGLLHIWGAAGPPCGVALGLWVYALILGLGGRASVWRNLCVGDAAVWLLGGCLTWLVATWLVGMCAHPLTALLVAVPGGMLTYGTCLASWWLLRR